MTLDNLSKGFRESVLFGAFRRRRHRRQRRWSGNNCCTNTQSTPVIHFAAHRGPGIGQRPADVLPQQHLRDAQPAGMLYRGGRKTHFVFSSTAAVYGTPESAVLGRHANQPDQSLRHVKLMTEYMLRDLSAASDLRYVILRYFNVAGSGPGRSDRPIDPGATLLMKVAAEQALGKRDAGPIFGTDYPTPDGTGVRDYIHVDDLADAHLKAIDYLRAVANHRSSTAVMAMAAACAGDRHGAEGAQTAQCIEQAAVPAIHRR